MIAHRGDSGSYPENTISAFKAAAEAGADMIEFDIQPSLDGQLVVFHDEELSRTTNGAGKLSRMTLSDLKRLDAGGWFSGRFAGERIPTLEEALESIPRTVALNIELKSFRETPPYEERFVEVFEKYRLHHRAYAASSDLKRLRRVAELDAGIRTILLQDALEEDDCLSHALRLGASAVQIQRRSLREDFIRRLHRERLLVFLFYADTKQEFELAVRCGVDGVLTNFPRRFLEGLA